MVIMVNQETKKLNSLKKSDSEVYNNIIQLNTNSHENKKNKIIHTYDDSSSSSSINSSSNNISNNNNTKNSKRQINNNNNININELNNNLYSNNFEIINEEDSSLSINIHLPNSSSNFGLSSIKKPRHNTLLEIVQKDANNTSNDNLNEKKLIIKKAKSVEKLKDKEIDLMVDYDLLIIDNIDRHLYKPKDLLVETLPTDMSNLKESELNSFTGVPVSNGFLVK